MDAIMRYIRSFSELSGKIRYSGQKRILVEMEFVRLCRPEMEVKQDALLDRIRKLEQTLEQTVAQIESGAIAVQAVPGSAAAGSANAGMQAAPVKKPELPAAIPEDVKRIVASWPGIVGDISQPMRTYLKGAKLSLGSEGRLMVALEDGLCSDYFMKEPENGKLLEAYLSEFAQKNVEVEFRSVKSEREFESSYVDLTQIIHMDIEEE